MIDNLIFLSAAEVPFKTAGATIHQPTLKEISMIGTKQFYTGCELLLFSKESLSKEEQASLENYSDFDILISVLSNNEVLTTEQRDSVMMVLDLLFPGYDYKFLSDSIFFASKNNTFRLDSYTFVEFKEYLSYISCYSKTSEKVKQYNPKGELAKYVADKLKKAQEKRAREKGQNTTEDFNFLKRYASILAVGKPQDINSIMNYTIYQLCDEYERYCLKEAYDYNIKARMAGVSDIEEPEDWRKDLN